MSDDRKGVSISIVTVRGNHESAERGEVVTTDGPFPEAKEQLGGVWILDVPDHETAMAWARKATQACQGPVEVRPFQANT